MSYELPSALAGLARPGTRLEPAVYLGYDLASATHQVQLRGSAVPAAALAGFGATVGSVQIVAIAGGQLLLLTGSGCPGPFYSQLNYRAADVAGSDGLYVSAWPAHNGVGPTLRSALYGEPRLRTGPPRAISWEFDTYGDQPDALAAGRFGEDYWAYEPADFTVGPAYTLIVVAAGNADPDSVSVISPVFVSDQVRATVHDFVQVSVWAGGAVPTTSAEVPGPGIMVETELAGVRTMRIFAPSRTVGVPALAQVTVSGLTTPSASISVRDGGAARALIYSHVYPAGYDEPSPCQRGIGLGGPLAQVAIREALIFSRVLPVDEAAAARAAVAARHGVTP